MTTGALIFAFNNEQIDYVSMARWSAGNIRRHLNIPVCLITDTQHQDLSGFDKAICVGPANLGSSNKRYFSDYNTSVTWHNTNRMDAYDLSPWDQTLVLDADYVVASDQLGVILKSPNNFLAHRWATDITGLNDFTGLNYFGNYQMPMWWATVMMFRRSDTAKMIFDVMGMVRNNWMHYRNLYANNSNTYRNDHALSIALNTIHGHVQPQCSIPWKLASLVPEHKLIQLSPDQYRVDFVTAQGRARWLTIAGQDFHAMGKQQLGEIIANPC
jgi:hypothetical protein